MTFDNLNDPRQYLDAMAMIDTARTNHYPLEISKPRAQRSNQQNNFYYFCLKYYASQIGFTKMDAAKEFKEVANPDIFVREFTDKNGNVHKVIRSSADLTKEEMTSALNNFRVYAETYAGVCIPYEGDWADIRACEREIKQVEGYI
jgi:hypothetical protein